MGDHMADVDRTTIVKALRRMGLGEGDIVLLHSSLASLGNVEGGAETVIDAFLNVLAEDGTLVVPTFGALGIITEVLRRRPDAVHSIHPKASVAAVGAAAEAICRNHWQADMAHGPDTPYFRIADMGGYVCLLGVDQDRNTTLHTVEELLRLPYLSPTGEVTFDTPEGRVTKNWECFPGPHRDFIGIDRQLRNQGVVKMTTIGNAVVRLMKSADLIDAGKALGRLNPAFVLCDNPACEDCVRQRAALRRDRYKKESFRLSTVTSLAGHYAEEIADRCLDAGIDTVEIDTVWGRPVSMMSHERLEKALAVFREEGLTISALRLPCVANDMDSLFSLAKSHGIGALVLPLSDRGSALAAQAAETGIDLSFQNRAQSSWTVSDSLLALRKNGVQANLTFNPPEFAMAGEKPFLTSYRHRLRRFIDRVDAEDGGFDGTPRPLGRGNGEIKEILSILRCCSFAGDVTLGARNRFTGTLLDAARAMDDLLDSM